MNGPQGPFHQKIYSLWNRPESLFLRMVQDVGLNHFYTDSTVAAVLNPPYLRTSEKALKQLHKRVYRKKKVRLIAKKL